MFIKIREESFSELPQYEKVPIAFEVKSRFNVLPLDGGLGGLKLIEESVAPYIKDYDAEETYKPSYLPNRFDLSNWGVLSAFAGGKRVGGALVAWRSPEVEMLNGRDDQSCLWDLRVHPEHRNAGVGRQLFVHALKWAKARRCRRFVVETQNVNVPACRFYARQGCEIGSINRYAYDEALNEVQLLWYANI